MLLSCEAVVATLVVRGARQFLDPGLDVVRVGLAGVEEFA